MSELSEKEIIKSIENTLKYKNEVNLAPFKVQVVQGLLDLYQKEKEKNKQLENADLTTVYMNGFYDGEKKWKDKIKKRAIEYENNNEGYDCTTADYKQSQNIGKYLAYIELLKERN